MVAWASKASPSDTRILNLKCGEELARTYVNRSFKKFGTSYQTAGILGMMKVMNQDRILASHGEYV